MNSSHSRAISTVCDLCSHKLQSVSEMFILSCEARPGQPGILPTKDKNSQPLTPELVCDKLFVSIRTITTLMNALVTHVHMIASKWFEVCEGVQELTKVAIDFMQLSSHISYLVAMNFPGSKPSTKGLVCKYVINLSGLEIKLSCNRLKKARVEELSPQLIIDLCSNISKHITIVTDACRTAGEKLSNSEDTLRTSDQFKLCVKSVTCAAGCLIASIMSYKAMPSTTHRGRIITFCEPVLASSSALVSFATEDEFTGEPASLSTESADVHKAILGNVDQ